MSDKNNIRKLSKKNPNPKIRVFPGGGRPALTSPAGGVYAGLHERKNPYRLSGACWCTAPCWIKPTNLLGFGPDKGSDKGSEKTQIPKVVAAKAGLLLCNFSASRSLRARRRAASEPATPVLRAMSKRSNTQTGLHRALGRSLADIDPLLRHSMMCDQVRRHVTKRACRRTTWS